MNDFLAAYDAVLRRWPVPVEAIELTSPYGTTRVNACGPAGAPPLILLNGGGTTSTVWFANVASLSQVRRVYAVDRIGEAGRSQSASGTPRDSVIKTVDDLLGWLDQVIAGLGLERAELAGHSYGGWLALSYALRHQDRVARLVLLDPTQSFAGFKPSYLLHAVPIVVRPSADRVERFLAWETGGADLDADWLRLYRLGAEYRGAKVVTGGRPGAEQLREFAKPTLVVLAGASKAHYPGKVETGARHLPRAEVVILPGVSHHGMPFTHAAELNDLLTRFLTKA